MIDMHSLLREQYQAIYNEMIPRNKKRVEENGFSIDALLNSSIDTRRGIGIFAYYDDFTSSDFDTLYDEAIAIFPQQVIYHYASQEVVPTHKLPYAGLLHWTFFQLQSVVDEIPDLFEQRLREYKDALAKAIFTLPPLSIEFAGMSAVSSGILFHGYPDQDVNSVRENIRQQLLAHQLPFYEPYKSNIVHSTFVRLANTIDPKIVNDFVRKNADIKIGTLSVKKLYLGYASWRMDPSETRMLYEFDLLEKQVKEL
jgi:hypothetical protein